ncbi:competence ComEA helix-hairpin-helix repeat region domain protein [Yersinia ruckeri]|uniref:ComEA family DNA-binding protein n=1 Tax=Yersinia ruckeri TaxID=29486 RepID=UPI0005AC1290|nr:ComEA family DNA-binding protein [Yersinia ruckeri]AJI95176.1 competence ComEA helix-hairpin-helix repeat region domain protein [Yersinia ruckeri]MCW6567659.1 ComEA family DNA-binding protein [Yersinia ruckeri]
MNNKGKTLALVLLLASFTAPFTAVMAAPNQTQENQQAKSPKVSHQLADKHRDTSKLKTPSPGSNREASSQIDVNKASAEELAAGLSGIGLKKAQAIVRYREEFGFFSQLEQLLEVSGIGPMFIERNRQKIKI